MTGETAAARFKAYGWMTVEDILRARSVQADDGCLYWTGFLTRGYGKLKYKGTQHPVHVWAYLEAHGLTELPPGYQVDHNCHNEDPTCVGRGEACLHRRCIAEEHLRLTTPAVNTNAPTSANVKKTHCPENHEYTPENTYVPPGTNLRNCRACATSRTKEWKRQQRIAEGRDVKVCAEDGCGVELPARAGRKNYCDEHGKPKYVKRRMKAKKTAK